MSNNVHLEADFTLNSQPDIQADFIIETGRVQADFKDITGGPYDNSALAEALNLKADISTVESLSETVDNNYSTLDSKIDTEATERENNDLLLQNGINTLSDDLTAEISNRGTADVILQDNIDTLIGTVTSNYNTLDEKIGDNKTAIDNHKADKNNPHEVTKEQIGLGNVDNTSDLDKPISTATQQALDGKASNSIEINGQPLTGNINISIEDLTTESQQNALNSGATSTNIGQIATNTQAISTEVTNRQNADNNLQSQIDALIVASEVFDIVGTYAELQAYDISTVPVNDIIKVLVDSTHNNAATYYRCVENDNVKSWSYIGAEGAYYTKSEADNRFVEQTTTVNGQALSNNITLDASDVGALPDTTTIGNGTLTIQKNGSTIDTFGANNTSNTTVNITVPTDTSDLTNNAGYIKGINSLDVTNALGYTPADESDLATVATSGSYDDLLDKPTIPSPITVDSALSTTSENPVQNKVITDALNGKVNTSDYVAYTANEVQTLWESI